MYSYINLGIGNAECPHKEKAGPFAPDAAEGQEKERGLRKMAAGMGRGKAGAPRAVIDKKTDMLGYGRILTGPYPHYILFDELAADQIGQDGG